MIQADPVTQKVVTATTAVLGAATLAAWAARGVSWWLDYKTNVRPWKAVR